MSSPQTLRFAIFSAVLGMYQFGFNTGVINAPQTFIEKFINETYPSITSSGSISLLFSIAVCSCLVGGMIGGVSAGYIADRFGRRNGIWYTQTLSILGGILMGISKVSNSYELLVIGRFFIGLACGFFTGLVPLYITEISPVYARGSLGTVNQLAVTSGILCSQILGLSAILGTEELWPILLALGALLPSVVQTILLPFMPESPNYLIFNKKNEEKGRKNLKRLRHENANIDDEINEIIASSEMNESGDNMSVIKLIMSKELRLPLTICIIMHLSQQLSGIVAIFYYSTKFFVNVGVSEDSAQYATLGVGAIMVSMTMITIPLMDRLGRRTLHLTGLAGIWLFSLLITIGLNVSDASDSWVGYFIIICTFCYVVSFALGPGSIPWLITGELFEQGPRAAAIAIATVVNWSANLIVGLIFPPMESALQNFAFFPFTICVTIFFIFLWYYLPETKGKTIGEITKFLARENAWKTKHNQE